MILDLLQQGRRQNTATRLSSCSQQQAHRTGKPHCEDWANDNFLNLALAQASGEPLRSTRLKQGK
jgi:hypothetical protein